jgi:hypothetical protein
MRKIDPTERALDAYFELDESQRQVFAAAVRHVERYAKTRAPEVTAQRRGRPLGSKSHQAAVAEHVAQIEARMKEAI